MSAATAERGTRAAGIFTGIVISMVHVAAVVALFNFSWHGLGVALVMVWLTGSLGISLAYHRMLCHMALNLVWPLEALVIFIGSLAWQGNPTNWVATHRKHHTCSDEEGDPHTPIHNFFWGHMGWMMLPEFQKMLHAEALKFTPDLQRSPVVRFFDKTYPIYQVLLGVFFYLWGGWSVVLWGIAVRLVFVWHSTWFVNSATHVWGYRRYSTKDDSTNLWWVALITFGEGWHNNHHGDQRAAKFARKWWELDTTFMVVRVLQALRLARQVKLPTRLTDAELQNAPVPTAETASGR